MNFPYTNEYTNDIKSRKIELNGSEYRLGELTCVTENGPRPLVNERDDADGIYRIDLAQRVKDENEAGGCGPGGCALPGEPPNSPASDDGGSTGLESALGVSPNGRS